MPTTTIELAGKERELRYDLGQVRKLKKQFKFKDYEELAKNLQPEDYLPAALVEGAEDKEGLTIAGLEKELTGPDLDRAFIAFCTAFFPPRVAQMLAVAEETRERLLKEMDTENAKKMAALEDQTVQTTT